MEVHVLLPGLVEPEHLESSGGVVGLCSGSGGDAGGGGADKMLLQKECDGWKSRECHERSEGSGTAIRVDVGLLRG